MHLGRKGRKGGGGEKFLFVSGVPLSNAQKGLEGRKEGRREGRKEGKKERRKEGRRKNLGCPVMERKWKRNVNSTTFFFFPPHSHPHIHTHTIHHISCCAGLPDGGPSYRLLPQLAYTAHANFNCPHVSTFAFFFPCDVWSVGFILTALAALPLTQPGNPVFCQVLGFFYPSR